jgi:hypothetical protein
MLFHQLDDETGFIIGADTVAGGGSNLRFFYLSISTPFTALTFSYEYFNDGQLHFCIK